MTDFFERPSPEIIDFEAVRQRALDAELAQPRAEVLAKSAAIQQAATYLINSLAVRGIAPDTVIYDIPNTVSGPSWFGLKRPVDKSKVHGQGWLLDTVIHYGEQNSYAVSSPDYTIALCLQQDGQFVNAVYQFDGRLKHTRTLDMSDDAIFDTLGIQGSFVLYVQQRRVHESDKVRHTKMGIDQIETALLVAGKSLLQAKP